MGAAHPPLSALLATAAACATPETLGRLILDADPAAARLTPDARHAAIRAALDDGAAPRAA